MKICYKCGIEKDESNFRIRKDVRVKTPNKICYNNNCYECDAELQRERTRKERLTEDGRKKHNNWAKEFHKRHREKRLAYMAERRKTPEYKEYMKAYREKRKDIIRQQEIVTKKRYHEKNKNQLTDKYALNLLKTQGKIGDKDLNSNKELVEIKKTQVLVSRIKKKISEIEKPIGEKKVCTKCKTEKDLSEFYLEKSKKGAKSRKSECKKCSNQRSRKYHQNNKK